MLGSKAENRVMSSRLISPGDFGHRDPTLRIEPLRSTLIRKLSGGYSTNLGESLGSAVLDHVFHCSLVGLYCGSNAASVMFHEVANRKDGRKSVVVWHG